MNARLCTSSGSLLFSLYVLTIDFVHLKHVYKIKNIRIFSQNNTRMYFSRWNLCTIHSLRKEFNDVKNSCHVRGFRWSVTGPLQRGYYLNKTQYFVRLAVEILRTSGELLKQSFSFFEDLTGWPREKSLYLLYALEQEHKQPPKARGIPYKLPLIISTTGLIHLR